MPVVPIPPWAWPVFGIVLAMMLTIDLVAHRGGRERSHRAAVVWTVIWVAAGLGFAVFVWIAFGAERATEYLAAYLIEKALSFDNLFVFLVIFRSLAIPEAQHHTVLSWGVFGALVFRAIFVFLGATVLARYQAVTYVFAAFLFWAALRTIRERPEQHQESALVHFLSRHLPVTRQLHEDRFFVREDGRMAVTPLLVAVLTVELTDIAFAVDSVPAALSVSRDRFVIYSSNAFALLGLRALYVVLETSLTRMRYLHYGLAAVLTFAAFKLVAAEWVHIPPLVSVAIIATCIGAAAAASARAPQ